SSVSLRTLHSFPTRRSSDLRANVISGVLPPCAATLPVAASRNAKPDRNAMAPPPPPPPPPGAHCGKVTISKLNAVLEAAPPPPPDRKSTRLNSSHVKISYAV